MQPQSTKMHLKLKYRNKCSLVKFFSIKLNIHLNLVFLLATKAKVILQLQFSPLKTYFWQF